MAQTIYDPIVSDVSEERREYAQEEFGRHLLEHRNRSAALIRKWIETDVKYPIPIYDRLLDRVRRLEPDVRADVASISLLMADEIVANILIAFARGDEMRTGDVVVNYAIVAQMRRPGSDDVIEQVDVNRGKPVIAMWDRYKKWLGRFTPSQLRASSTTTATS